MPEQNDFRETLYTVDSRGRRKWVYVSPQDGYFKTRRSIVALILILIYVSLPWLQIAGEQSVFLDITGRKFTFFGVTFWATDSKFLLLILAGLGISLFLFTSLLGRVWCGWACPQTVFLDFVFRPIEYLIEGNAARRKKLDQAEWSLKKFGIKGTKYFLFTFISWFLASTLLAYFVGRETLLQMMSDYPWNNLPTFLLTILIMSAILFEFGWFREQFCTTLCPYARFQSVLLDSSSLVIAYDSARGEPRGKATSSGKGDCIDCGLCVRVCPSGIDIRNGLQLECVQCAACVDACDSIMKKISRPLGLIRYSTERGLQGEKYNPYRARVIIYASILLGLFAVFYFSLSTRELSEVMIIHSKTDGLFTKVDEANIQNHLELNISNKSKLTKDYTISIPESPDLKVVLPMNPFPIPGTTHQKIPLFVTFAKSSLVSGKRPITIKVTEGTEFKQILKLDLLGPG